MQRARQSTGASQSRSPYMPPNDSKCILASSRYLEGKPREVIYRGMLRSAPQDSSAKDAASLRDQFIVYRMVGMTDDRDGSSIVELPRLHNGS